MPGGMAIKHWNSEKHTIFQKKSLHRDLNGSVYKTFRHQIKNPVLKTFDFVYKCFVK